MSFSLQGAGKKRLTIVLGGIYGLSSHIQPPLCQSEALRLRVLVKT